MKYKTLRDLKAEADAEPLDLMWENIDANPAERDALEKMLTHAFTTMDHAELMYLRLVHDEDVSVVGRSDAIEGEERDEWITRMEAELIDRYKLLDIGHRYVSVMDLLTN